MARAAIDIPADFREGVRSGARSRDGQAAAVRPHRDVRNWDVATASGGRFVRTRGCRVLCAAGQRGRGRGPACGARAGPPQGDADATASSPSPEPGAPADARARIHVGLTRPRSPTRSSPLPTGSMAPPCTRAASSGRLPHALSRRWHCGDQAVLRRHPDRVGQARARLSARHRRRGDRRRQDTCVRLGKEAACLRVVGSSNPDPDAAGLEDELTALGNYMGSARWASRAPHGRGDPRRAGPHAYRAACPSPSTSFASRRAGRPRLFPRPRGVSRRPAWFTDSYRRQASNDADRSARRRADGRGAPDHARFRRGDRRLDLGDVVYVSGVFYTAREGVYHQVLVAGRRAPRRAARAVQRELPVRARCQRAARRPLSRGGGTATASFRFGRSMRRVVRALGARVIVGKAGLTERAYREWFVPHGAVYSTTVATDGCGLRALHQARRDVYWLRELGIAQALWVLEVERIGPFLVEGDARGGASSRSPIARSTPASTRSIPTCRRRPCRASARSSRARTK